MKVLRIQSRAQSTVYQCEKAFCTAENLTNITFPNKPFQASIDVLLGEGGNASTLRKLLIGAGYSMTTSTRQFHVELPNGSVYPEFYCRRKASEVQRYISTDPVPAGAWTKIAVGWDGANAWMQIGDNARQEWPHAEFDCSGQAGAIHQRVHFGSSSVNHNSAGYQFYNVTFAFNSGGLVANYPCNEAPGATVALNSVAGGAEFNADIRYGTGGLTPVQQAPWVTVPNETIPPVEPGEYRFTAACSDPTATFSWWCSRDNLSGTPGQVYHPIGDATNGLSGGYSISGSNNEFLDFTGNSQPGDTGYIAPKAHTAVHVDGKLADPPSRLEVIEVVEPEPPDPKAGIIYQYAFDDPADEGRYADGLQYSSVWKPRGMSTAGCQQNLDAHDPTFPKGLYQTTYDGVPCMHFAYNCTNNERFVGIPSQPMTELGKHLTNDRSKGFDDIYVRFHVRLPDDFTRGYNHPQTGAVGDVDYWKFMRVWQNVDLAHPMTEQRVDSGFIVCSLTEQLNQNNASFLPTCSMGTAGQNMARGSSGGDRTKGRYHVQDGQPSDPTQRKGNFERMTRGDGEWQHHRDAPLSPEYGSLEKTVTGGGPQTWHTLEWRIKLADSSNPTATIDLWLDGEAQSPPQDWRRDTLEGGREFGYLPPTLDRIGSGINFIQFFDNMAKQNAWHWHVDGRGGGIYLRDVVISTERIGHDHVVDEFIDNVGQPGWEGTGPATDPYISYQPLNVQMTFKAAQQNAVSLGFSVVSTLDVTGWLWEFRAEGSGVWVDPPEWNFIERKPTASHLTPKTTTTYTMAGEYRCTATFSDGSTIESRIATVTVV